MTAPNPQHHDSQKRREQLERELGMSHLAEAKATSVLANSQKDAEGSLTDDPKMQEQYAFSLDWKDARGKRWQGAFTNKILTLREHKIVGAMRAKQAGFAPVESLHAATVNLVHISCWMEISLVERPKWMEDMDSLHDVALLEAVFLEVAAHEKTFHGYKQFETAGAAAG